MSDVQYVRRAGSDPSFLLKAMSEAGGELRSLLAGQPLGALLEPGERPDEDWCLMGIAFHMKDVEQRVMQQLRPMVMYQDPEIPHVDFDDIPFRTDYEFEDDEDLMDAFYYYRRRTTYMLWDLDMADWERRGIHPYRGPISVTDIARDLYQHDLEHMWQARRMVEAQMRARR
jgi:hypothetical protein